MKSIFEYLDYRKYLSDFIIAKKKRSAIFSYRYIEQKTGVDASNIAKIIQNKRHIGDGTIGNFSDLLQHNAKEREYFEILVNFGKARTDKKRKQFFEELLNFNKLTIKLVQPDQYEFYQHWYYTAVAALIHMRDIKVGNYQEIADSVRPPITKQEAKESVLLLKRLKFVRISTHNTYVHTDNFVSAEEQWYSIAINTYQRQNIERALDSMDNDPIKARNLSTLTVTLSDESYQKAKEVLAECRKNLLKVAKETPNPDRVYQLNMQLFPLSQFEDLDDE